MLDRRFLGGIATVVAALGSACLRSVRKPRELRLRPSRMHSKQCKPLGVPCIAYSSGVLDCSGNNQDNVYMHLRACIRTSQTPDPTTLDVFDPTRGARLTSCSPRTALATRPSSAWIASWDSSTRPVAGFRCSTLTGTPSARPFIHPSPTTRAHLVVVAAAAVAEVGIRSLATTAHGVTSWPSGQPAPRLSKVRPPCRTFFVLARISEANAGATLAA